MICAIVDSSAPSSPFVIFYVYLLSDVAGGVGVGAVF